MSKNQGYGWLKVDWEDGDGSLDDDWTEKEEEYPVEIDRDIGQGQGSLDRDGMKSVMDEFKQRLEDLDVARLPEEEAKEQIIQTYNQIADDIEGGHDIDFSFQSRKKALRFAERYLEATNYYD